jgi:hypothetical protein
MQLEHQLVTLLVGHVEMVLLGQFRIITADDSVVTLLQVCRVSATSKWKDGG